jgi:hypothetical protein
MNTCESCGIENEDQATKCRDCGAELVRLPVSTEPTLEEPTSTERFEKAASLDNEVQAELMDEILSGRQIPHIMQSYHDSALDGLWQAGKGWGVILAPVSFKEEILAALADVKRQSQASSGEPEVNNS